ncbi:hypothetical protein PJ912_16565 [Pectobacterium colocasium]|uniref:hypothetical protein n=1 Tax=Pectobacterium TaxID=122277 RepID=UPI003D7616BB
MSKEGFNTDDIDSIVARCSKRRRVDESNLKHKTLETGALPSATHDAGVVILSCVANTLSHHQSTSNEGEGYGYRIGNEGPGFYCGSIKVGD